MTFRLGLTGSIGMGKSTTAQLFADAGCAVWDADAAVHRLYAPGGAAVAPMARAFPDAIVDGAVDRGRLKAIIGADASALKRIEAIVHPLVAEDRRAFLDATTADIAVLDIPLLFEGGGETSMDATAVVSVDAQTQRQRVLDRGTMTEAQFDHILSRQMPDAEKRARADYVIVTDTLDHARQQILDIVETIRESLNA
ncbi:Dephospho-CoA kinase [Marinibacterium anthonyi]|nr:Dephospho-CoA kinase [Marinibacterium anthonyi]